MPYQHAVRLHDALTKAGVANQLLTIPLKVDDTATSRFRGADTDLRNDSRVPDQTRPAVHMNN